MKMSMEHLWNDIDMGKPKYSERNPSWCHVVYHKSHMYLLWKIYSLIQCGTM